MIQLLYPLHLIMTVPMLKRCGATAKKPEDDRPMIACDYPGCPIEWYHLECLKLEEIPKGDWYCPDCRKKFTGRRPRDLNK